jgi:hypothetical protein
MHTEGHDMGRDAADSSTPGDQFNPDNPGYETTDVHVKGVSVFLAGLFAVVILFFFFCYSMGRVINGAIESDYAKLYGMPNKWHGGPQAKAAREDLKSNSAIEQQELQQMTSSFPAPRLDIDDGNQATADLHAREDLLLNNYSRDDDQPGVIRIPISRAMELIAQRGLPVEGAATTATAPLAHAEKPELRIPLTTGFARTGFELTTIEAREQKMNYGKAEATQAEMTPQK